MNPDQQAWDETRDQRRREQIARERAELERLQQEFQAAREMGTALEQQRVQAEMNKIAARQSQRYRNAQTRDEAAQRMQRALANPVARGAVEFQGYEVTPLTEGVPPVAMFDASLRMAEVTESRRARLQQGYLTDVGQPDVTAEDARMALGRAMQVAIDSKTITEQQGLLMMVAGGLNADPMSQAETRTLLFDLLAQAVKSKQLGLGRARTIARLIQDAPTTTEEAPGEVPVPESEELSDLQTLRALALMTVPFDQGPLTPVGLEQRSPSLQTLARAIPELVDRLEALETLVYDALQVLPCHAGHQRHLDTPTLCDVQAANLARALVVGLGLSERELPRDTHRGPDGERAGCCVKDGRIGTWLVFGQLINPDQLTGMERRRAARAQVVDEIDETEDGS